MYILRNCETDFRFAVIQIRKVSDLKLKKSVLMKNIARIISFSVAIMNIGLISTVGSYAAGVSTVDYQRKSETQEAIEYLSMMQIIEDTASYTDETAITKSEAAELIVRSLDACEIATSATYADEFYKMFDDIETAECFGYAIKQGIISGDAAGNYGVNDNVTYAQAAKMLVCAMGYGQIAQTSGGWYEGYINQANKVGITKNVSAANDLISKLDFAHMLRNCFKAKVPHLKFTSNSVVISPAEGATLEENYLASKGWIIGEGIVNANEKLSIMNGIKVDEGKILIGDDAFKINDSGIDNYIGYKVKYVAQNPDDGGAVIGFYIAKANYYINLSHQEDCMLVNNLFKYKDIDTGRYKELNISPSAAYIYNNRLSETLRNSNIDFSNTDITFIDNNGDEIFDVVRIIESKSFTVKKINESSEKIYLKSGLYKGSASINLENEDEDRKIVIRNIDGTDADWKTLKEDDSVSIIQSDDGVYLEIIILNKPLEGCVTSYEENENVIIDSNVYELTESVDNIALGVFGRFWLNEYNEIFLCDYTTEEYAYIMAAEQGTGISDQISVKLFDNKNGVNIFECSDNLKINGVKTSVIGHLPVGQIAVVKINSENLITKIDSVEVYAPKGDRTYCEYAHAFNDSDNVNMPFKFGESTEFYIIPQNGEDEDFGMLVDYEDGDNYITTAYGFDDSTGIVDAVVVTVDTEALRNDSLSYKSEVGIVNNIKAAIDDDGQWAYFVNGFSEGEEFNYISGHYDDVFNVMSALKKGDVIRFNKGYGNKILRIEKLASLSTLTDPFHTGRDDEEEKFFGTVMISDEEVITNSSQYLYNELYVSDEKSYDDMTLMRVWADRKNIKDEDCQFNDYYIYEGKGEPVRIASMDDIVTYEMSTADPSKVFIYRTYSEVKMIVIVK